MSAEQLIVRLYESRKALSDAKSAITAYMRGIESGELCEFKDSTTPPCYYGELGTDTSEWCETCRGRQPLLEERKRQSIESGNALRAVLRMGKKLSKTKPDAAVNQAGMRSLTPEERQTITEFFWKQMEKVDLKGMVKGMVEDEEFRGTFSQVYKQGETPKPAIGWSGEPK